MKKFLLSMLLAALALTGVYASTNEVLRVDFENGLPSGWTQEYAQLPVTQSGSQALYSWSVEVGDSLTYPAGCVSGTHRAKAANTTNQEMRFVTRLVTPVIDLAGIFRPQLVFWHAEPARASFCDTLRVYYRRSATDYWHLLPNAEYTRNGRWTEQTINLISPNSTYQVAFEISESMGRGVVLDDIVFRSTPICEDVSNIVCSNIHAYDVTLSWDAYGVFSEFQVMVADQELDLQNIDQSHVIVNLTEGVYDPSTIVTGLQPETTYYVYVRSDCEENESGFTNWVSTSFRTLKVAYLPYAEDFNSSIAITGNIAYGMPDGWTMGNSLDEVTSPFIIRNNTITNRALYSVDSTAYLSFVGAMEIDVTPVPESEYVYAVTPQIVAESLQGLQVRFWLTAGQFVPLGVQNYGGTLIVGTISDPTNFRTFHPIDTVKIDINNMFKHVTVSLDNYTGDDKFIALVSSSDMANAMFVDNFTMSLPDAPVPAEVTLSNVHSTGFTVKPSLHGATSWDLVVSTEYARNGEVNPSSYLLQQNNISAASYPVERADLPNQIVYVYTRTHKNNATSAWSFARVIRVPSAMPVITEETSYTNSFESGNSLQLNTLDAESRVASSFRGISNVYYPLLAVDADITTYPLCVSTQPNYRGSHAQLCGIDSWFVLPEADSINTLKMVFRHASMENMSGKLAIGLMTEPYDLSTFEQVAVFEAEGKEYLRCLVSFDSYTGAGKYIAFRSLNAGSGMAASTNLIDEIIVSKLGRCREASNVQINPHADYAEVSWNGGGMDAWIIGLSTQKNMLNATYTTVTTPNISFNNLESQKTYYCTIQTICGQDTLPLDDVRYTFRTPRGLPITEVFSAGIPSGWSQSTTQASQVFAGTKMNTTSAGWTVTNAAAYVNAPMSGYVAYRSLYQSSNKYGWLISPELYVDAAPDKPLELVFDLGMATYSSTSTSYVYGEAGPNDVFMVAVSEDGGNTWLRKNVTVWDNKGQGNNVLNDLIWDGGERIRIDFTPYIGKRIKFAFYLESMSTNHHDNLVIDNVILREGDDRCGGLTGLTAYAPSVNSATANWQLAGLNPWPAVVQLSTSANFASLLANDTIQGNTKSYTNLEPNTMYYVRAHQLCVNDGDWKKTSFHTPCTAVTPEALGTEMFDGEDAIGCWAVGHLVANSTGDLPQRKMLEQYGAVLEIAKNTTDTTASDGTFAIMPELDLDDAVKNITHYQVIFRAGTHSNAADNVHRLSVGIVTDPTDVSYTWSKQAEINLQYAADSTELKTYVVSFENYTGDFDGYMGHYIMFYSEAGTDSTNYILIDDVMVTDLDGCRMVIDMEADSITVAGARLHWTGNSPQYEVAVSATRVNPDTCRTWLYHETVSSTFCHIGGLEATTRYYAYIRAICDQDNKSRWSSASYFNTRLGVPYLQTFDDLTTYIAEADIRQATGVHFPGDSVILTPELKTPSSFSGGWLLDQASNYANVKGIAGKIAKMDIYSNYSFWLVLPTLDLSTAADDQIQFSAKVGLCSYSGGSTPATSTDDRLGVIVSLDGGTTWYKRDAKFWSCDGTGDYPYEFGLQAKRIEVDMTDYAGQAITIAILGESTASGSDNWLIVDSISVQKLSSECMGVRNAEVNLSGTSSAVATWRVVGTPKEVAYEWSDMSDFSSVLFRDTTEADSAVFTGLELDKMYYLRLTQVGCTTSVIRTLKTPFAIPYTEAFSASSLPDNWQVMRGNVEQAFDTVPPEVISSSQAWKVSTSSNGLPANHIMGELKNTALQNEMWLVAPEVIIPAGAENVKLSFDLALTGHSSATAPITTAGQEFRVLVSTDGGKSWKANQQWLFKDNDANAYRALSSLSAQGENIVLPMDAYVDKSVRIAFYKAATANDNDLHIANFQLREVGEQCDLPTDVVVSNITFTQASLSWNGTPEKATVIEYATLPDFSNARRDTVYNEFSHTLNNLRTGSTYYVHLMQLCGANSISEFTDAVTFTTLIGVPYENAFASIGNWQRYESAIANGLSDTLTAATGGWKESTSTAILGAPHIYCSNSSKALWLVSPAIALTNVSAETNLRLTVDLALTQTYSKSNAPTATGYGTTNKFYIAVSTDGGQTFLRENAWEFSSAADADYIYKDIPAGEGNTYRMDFSRFIGSTIHIAFVSMATKVACINVARLDLSEATSSCFGVSNVAVGKVDTAAVLTVTPLDAATQWEIAYGLHNTALDRMTGHHIADSTTTVIGGLSLNSTYDLYCRSICGDGDSSVWCGPYSFTTPTGIPYEAPFNATFNGWTRYTGDPEAVFAGTDSIKPTTTGWTAYNSSSYALGMPHIYCTQSLTTANWLVSPSINLMPQDGTKSIWLNFRAALTSTATSLYAPTQVAEHNFRIAYSEDDGATWTEDNIFLWGDDSTKVDYIYSSIPTGAGKAYHLDLSSLAGKVVRLALIQGAAPTGQSCIHVAGLELVEYDVPCFDIEKLNIQVDVNVAHCTIIDGANVATAWQYAYGLSGYTPSDDDAVTVTTKKFDISNLPMTSTIDFYARSLCGEEATSAWVGPVTVRMPVGVPFHEPLNETSMPSGWASQSVNSGTWYVGNSKNNYVWGANHAYINIYSNYKARLVSPEIALIDLGTDVELSFDLALTKYGTGNPIERAEGQSFYVEISTDGGKTFEPIAVWGDSQDDYVYESIPTAGERYHVDLSEFIGESIRLGFYAEATYGTGGPDNDLHIRNVDVDTFTTPGIHCARIRKAEVVDKTLHSAKLILRGSKLDEALAFQYVCQPENSIFNPSLAVTTDTTVIDINGLNSSSGYELFVRAQCVDSTWGGWQGPFLFHTVECSTITGVTSLNVSSNEAVLRLETPNPNAAIGYQAYLCEEGEPLMLDNILTFRSDTVQFTQRLAYSTIYHVYARKICEVGDTSIWCGPFEVQSPLGVPYYEPLSGYTSLPAGWTCLTKSGNAWESSTKWSMGKGSYVWGEEHAAINTYSTYNGMLVSPEISTEGVENNLLLSFDLALTKYATSTAPVNTDNQTLEIRVSTDGGQTFDRPVATFGDADAQFSYADIPVDGERYIIDLSRYAGQSVRIGFHAISGGNTGDNDLHLREVMLDTVATRCSGVKNVRATEVSLSSAKILFEFADQDDMGEAMIEVALDKDFTQLLFQDVISGTTTYSLTGLNPSTTYFVRVARSCDSGQSLWSSTSFTTNYGVRYQEDFEVSKRFSEWTHSTTATSTVFAKGDLPTSSTTRWSLKTTNADIFETQHITMNVWSTNTGWAVTPLLDLTPNAGQGLLLAFDLALCKYSGGGVPDATIDDSFYVIVSEDGGDTWLRSNATSWKTNGTNADYNYSALGIVPQRFILDMTRYAGRRVKIAFVAESLASGDGDNNIMIDNIDLNTAISVVYNDTICQYEDYDMHELFYPADTLQLGDNTFRIISDNFDRVTTVNIFVKELPKSEVADTICEGELYTGHGFDGLVATQSGPYSRYIERAEGCDSILTLNLTVIPKSRTVVEDTLCDGSVYEFKGKSYYHDVILVDTLSSALTGCDSIVTYYITFSGEAVSQSDVYAVICAGQRYRDELFSETETGVYIETTATVNGCDSIVTLHLFVADAEGALYDTIKASQLPYIYDGRELIPADADKNDYSFKLESVNEGCEPTLYVHIDRTDAISNIVAENLEIAPNPVQVGETLNVLTDLTAGEFTATVYNAIGQEVYTVTEFTTALPGLPASGIYMVRIQTGKNLYEGKVLVK